MFIHIQMQKKTECHIKQDVKTCMINSCESLIVTIVMKLQLDGWKCHLNQVEVKGIQGQKNELAAPFILDKAVNTFCTMYCTIIEYQNTPYPRIWGSKCIYLEIGRAHV